MQMNAVRSNMYVAHNRFLKVIKRVKKEEVSVSVSQENKKGFLHRWFEFMCPKAKKFCMFFCSSESQSFVLDSF